MTRKPAPLQDDAPGQAEAADPSPLVTQLSGTPKSPDAQDTGAPRISPDPTVNRATAPPSDQSDPRTTSGPHQLSGLPATSPPDPPVSPNTSAARSGRAQIGDIAPPGSCRPPTSEALEANAEHEAATATGMTAPPEADHTMPRAPLIPPKPAPRAERVSLWRHLRLFRRDLLSAQPARLYRAWMAEFKTPFFRSYLINAPELIDTVLRARPGDFPKSRRVGEGLRPLLGASVFLTNGATWQRQRRIIDPAFEGGRLHDTFPAMVAAGRAALLRLDAETGMPLDIDPVMSHLTADVIFRTLFSLPIQDATAARVYDQFRAYQRAQPILNAAAFLPLPRWMPRGHKRQTLRTARALRGLIASLVTERQARILDGTAPDDLATKIMTTSDPETGARFTSDEMVDQVAIFFLAGHETSAAALSWALYLLACAPDWQDRVAAEAAGLPEAPQVSDLSRLSVTRDVLREALRLYPPVPMMVRETTGPETFRDRPVRPGSQVVISPWHLHRHSRLWHDPDAFDPARWQDETTRQARRQAYCPFSAGPRVCPGAGFAMLEGTLLLAMITRRFRLEVVPDRPPVPVAHLTVRARDGVWLQLTPRDHEV